MSARDARVAAMKALNSELADMVGVVISMVDRSDSLLVNTTNTIGASPNTFAGMEVAELTVQLGQSVLKTGRILEALSNAQLAYANGL